MSSPVDPGVLSSICAEAGEFALRRWRLAMAEPVAFDSKGDGSPVTETDRRVEALLREALTRLDPGIPVVGEEGGGDAGDGDLVWAVDPIDGTRAFIAGMPTWTVSVGLLQGGRPVLGCVVLPASQEGRIFLGGEGVPLTRDGRPVAPAVPRDVSEKAVLVPSDTHRRYRIGFRCRARSFGSTALHLALVAGGSSLAALVHESYLWDLAGGMALLSASGCTVARLDGSPVELGRHLDGSRFHGPLLAAPPWAYELIAGHIERQPC
jgi:fructose-1,6-bisphosphatase/inositol monophosphatase family enzyme